MEVNQNVQDHRNLFDWSSVENGTYLPIDMRFNDGHRLSIIGYSILMVFSAIGNISILVLILRRRRQTPSRINTALMHLAIADLLVTFLMMPLEIVWAYTVSWWAGDAMCRCMAFFRMFGLYLSSFILVCISMDRYYAVLKPLHLTGVDRRGKFMLTAAWMGATVCSLPQMLIFQVETHPEVPSYEQCITYNVLPSYTHQVIYSAFGSLMMYAFPLGIIIYTYAAILMEIYRRTRNAVGADRIRRSSLGFLGRAKIRTLKMTIIIVLVFFVCWTPYNVMMLWYWYDRETAIHVDQRIQKGLFLFACTNSCMNPIVYGAFNIRARRTTASAGAQVAELNTSQHRSSTMRRQLQQQHQHLQTPISTADGMDVVCLVSWKKQNDSPLLTHCTTTAAMMVDNNGASMSNGGATHHNHHHNHRVRLRDVCVHCGESTTYSGGAKQGDLCTIAGGCP